jgi:hypothetical protein
MNISVIGNNSSDGSKIFNLLNNGCKNWISKILSGAVNAPKKGKTAPILIISVKETKIVNKVRADNWTFRFFEMWVQKLLKRENVDSFLII